MQGKATQFDDEWILEHENEYPTQRGLFDAYLRICGMKCSFRTFIDHVRHDLKLTRYYEWSAEHDKWMCENLPDNGYVAAYEMFCRLFQDPGFRSFQHRAQTVCGGVSDKRKKEWRKQWEQLVRQKSRPDGTVSVHINGIAYFKQGSKWVCLSSLMNLPKGFIAVHRNGDVLDNEPENIAVISTATSMRMTKNALWSEFPEITDTGIMCCQLEELLSGKEPTKIWRDNEPYV